MYQNQKVAVVLLGGGSGVRFGSDKLLEKVNQKYVFEYALETFVSCDVIDEIVVVGGVHNVKFFKKSPPSIPPSGGEGSALLRADSTSVRFVNGGESRFLSVLSGVNTLFNPGVKSVIKNDTKHFSFEDGKQSTPGLKNTLLLFHNLANPSVMKEEIIEVIEKTAEHGAAGVAHQATSTLRHDSQGVLNRQQVWQMQTPQGLCHDVFQKGVQAVIEKDIDHESVTDDLMLAELAGFTPEIVPASENNFKITTPKDLEYFKFIMSRKLQPLTPALSPKERELRIGLGTDSHRFGDEGELILGGIVIPDVPRLEGNSDADPILHALCNALSSAMGGFSFSRVADELCQQGVTDSAEYVKYFLNELRSQQGMIEHISIAIEAGQPKLEKHLPQMQKRISEICNVDSKSIGITCTSGEKLTDVGRGEGVAVQVVVQCIIDNDKKLHTSSFRTAMSEATGV